MTDMGHIVPDNMAYYLGIEVSQKDEVDIGLKLNKKGDRKLVNPTYFKQLVGSLRYLTATRPDIAYGVGLISRYMEKPTQMHLQAAKRILRYIKERSTMVFFTLTVANPNLSDSPIAIGPET
uniref:Reverse transcriptase Ty1/copia-type domain-containing protein n=1 Tax=Ananas comosus var. bracteatus TaxID=296719 RepID=A0A6V7PFC7_ANACO|nr:unnamed protein product [Ananas comosus var. bracteatus]